MTRACLEMRHGRPRAQRSRFAKARRREDEVPDDEVDPEDERGDVFRGREVSGRMIGKFPVV